MAKVIATGTVTKGIPAPNLNIEIYGNGTLLKSTTWDSVAKGESVSDSVELGFGTWEVFAKAKVSNLYGTSVTESPHKTVEVTPSSETNISLEEGMAIHSILEVKGDSAIWTAQVTITRNQYSLIGFAWFVNNEFFGFVPGPRNDSKVTTKCTGTHPDYGCIAEDNLDLHSFPAFLMDIDKQIGPYSISLPAGTTTVEIRAYKLQGWGRGTSTGDAYNIFNDVNPPGSAAPGHEDKVPGIWGTRQGRAREEDFKANQYRCFYGAVEGTPGTGVPGSNGRWYGDKDCVDSTYDHNTLMSIGHDCCYSGMQSYQLIDSNTYLFRCYGAGLTRVFGAWSDWATHFSRSKEQAFASLEMKEVNKVGF